LVLEYSLQDLRERIKPYFLRRMKSEVFVDTGSADDKKLSKKNELIVWLKLTACQVQILVSLNV
jgi:SNF2 family DNA or RNA helicase